MSVGKRSHVPRAPRRPGLCARPWIAPRARGLVVLTHNLLTNFQIETGAMRRAPSRKRTVLHALQTIQSLRLTFFHRAAQLVRPHGTLRLRLTENPETQRTYERVARALARAA